MKADKYFQAIGATASAVIAFIYALNARTWIEVLLFAGVGAGMSVYAKIAIAELRIYLKTRKSKNN